MHLKVYYERTSEFKLSAYSFVQFQTSGAEGEERVRLSSDP